LRVRLKRGDIYVFRLQELGWTDFFSKQITQDELDAFLPARTAEENREIYKVFLAQGEHWAELAGKLRHLAASRSALPAVGDWVLLRMPEGSQRAIIHRVLTRRSKFSRKAAGKKTEEQIVAANIDTVFVVASLDQEFNPRRIERYLTLAWDSGARPVVVLNKADLCKAASIKESEAAIAGLGVSCVVASATHGDGLPQLRAHVRGGTVAFLGSSGVGKSSLINALLGEDRQETKAVREGDGKGRHTTTTRQMFLLPGGGILIDTPGMRELQLWDAAGGIGGTFGDIAALAEQCRFRDCRHESEPGCAVRAAVEGGSLDEERLASYHKLGREERFLEAKQDAAIRAEQTKSLKRLMRGVNRFYRERGR
jgi:ribosome biogenesis GTPase / thiamine phosphate phosphatase